MFISLRDTRRVTDMVLFDLVQNLKTVVVGIAEI
jgi:hypothetical protein